MSHPVRALDRNLTRKVSEEKAKSLREKYSRRLNVAFEFPPDAVCFAIVHESFRLRGEGYADEIDDVVAKPHGLEGWQVQHIVLYYAEMMVRAVEGMSALALNQRDFAADSKREAFSEAPGRTWGAA
jgi:hypothetical protein